MELKNFTKNLQNSNDIIQNANPQNANENILQKHSQPATANSTTARLATMTKSSDLNYRQNNKGKSSNKHRVATTTPTTKSTGIVVDNQIGPSQHQSSSSQQKQQKQLVPLEVSQLDTGQLQQQQNHHHQHQPQQSLCTNLAITYFINRQQQHKSRPTTTTTTTTEAATSPLSTSKTSQQYNRQQQQQNKWRAIQRSIAPQIAPTIYSTSSSSTIISTCTTTTTTSTTIFTFNPSVGAQQHNKAYTSWSPPPPSGTSIIDHHYNNTITNNRHNQTQTETTSSTTTPPSSSSLSYSAKVRLKSRNTNPWSLLETSFSNGDHHHHQKSIPIATTTNTLNTTTTATSPLSRTATTVLSLSSSSSSGRVKQTILSPTSTTSRASSTSSSSRVPLSMSTSFEMPRLDELNTSNNVDGVDGGGSGGAIRFKRVHSMSSTGEVTSNLATTDDGGGGGGQRRRRRSRRPWWRAMFGSNRSSPHDRSSDGGMREPPENRIVLVTGTHRYLSNGITTAKYNAITFLPKFLFEQFRRYSNIFFLFIALMQQIPNVSPTGRFTTAVPLVFIMLVSAIKEIFEDIKRHRADNLVNNTPIKVFNRFGSNFVRRKWKDVQVGDLVLVQQDNFFPSDLVLLSSKEPNGICYIETSNLDGETNLKARSSLRLTDELCSKATNTTPGTDNLIKEWDTRAITTSPLMTAVIECDPPNKMLYEFCGKLKIDNEEYPIGPDNILLRGAKLRNTEWAIGCVIYTGHETKLMMNSMSQAPLKQSQVEISTNKQILALLGILVVICLISAGASVYWGSENQAHWYIAQLQSQATSNFFLILLTFIILYNNLIPISLQVTLEMVRFIQAHFINCDLEMYDEETDTHAMARTSNLNEELGQVRYILSDKTGTLTRNVMEFKRCSISGHMYDEKKFYQLIEMIRRKEPSWERVREFLVLLSVCHTVIPEPTKGSESESRFTYTASSPDEAALVKGAQKIGFEFLQRTPTHVLIDAMGTTEKYEVLNVLEFNSDRKRMSVIVRTPNGQIKLYTKGADSIIQKRLCPASAREFAATTEINLTAFATDGLRTLCCAYVDIDEQQYRDWSGRWKKAMLMTKNTPLAESDGKTREECLNELMDEIESNLTLLGATAIEDKLQEGVPETIELLMRAGIKIWMLTGDKQETATNISYSCRLLRNVQNLESYHIVNEETLDATRESIAIAETKIANHRNDFTLIIDNKSLSYALQPQLQSTFMDIALQCRSVICCRVSPAQKAEIVHAVKRSTKSISLAIGDGANDVAMIKAANVGIGISGREGLQAVYSSDYAIAEFRFLARLLLVHGSWSLSRVCKLILYSFYKNIALYVIELWFASISAWSGQAVFERWSLSMYNVIFTAAPPLAIGLFDRTCSAEIMMNNPELYREQWNMFSIKLFWFWIASAIWHSLVLFWLTYLGLAHDALWANGKSDGGYLCFGNILYTYVVVTVCLKAALETSCWTIVTHISIWGSIGAWFLFLILYSRIWPTLPIGAEMASIDRIIFSTWLFWLGLAIIPFVALLVDIVVKLISRTCFKSLADKITELELAKQYQQQPSLSERARLLVNNFLPGTTTANSGVGTGTGTGGGAIRDRTDQVTIFSADRDTAGPSYHNNDSNAPSTAPSQLMYSATSKHQQQRHRHRNAGVTETATTAEAAAAVTRVRSATSTDAEIDAIHGYSFAQDENRELSQTKIIQGYNTRL